MEDNATSLGINGPSLISWPRFTGLMWQDVGTHPAELLTPVCRHIVQASFSESGTGRVCIFWKGCFAGGGGSVTYRKETLSAPGLRIEGNHGLC